MDERALKQIGDTSSSGDLGGVILGKRVGGAYGPIPLSSDGLSVATTPTSAGTVESGTDSTGQDPYATVMTPSAAKTHIMVVNEGTNAVVVSLDAGVTDHIKKIPGGFVLVLDNVSITTAAIQAKNFTAGQNYTNLTIYVW